MEISSELILKKATRVFARYGMKKTTMDDIAAEIGIVKGTIYNYFSNKEALFSAIIATESQAFLNALKNRVDACSNAEEKIRVFVRSNLELIFDYINLYKITQTVMHELSDLLPGISCEIDHYHKQVTAFIKNILNEGIKQNIFKPVDTDFAAETVSDLLQSTNFPIPKKMLDFDRASVMKKIDFFLDLILNGLKK